MGLLASSLGGNQRIRETFRTCFQLFLTHYSQNEADIKALWGWRVSVIKQLNSQVHCSSRGEWRDFCLTLGNWERKEKWKTACPLSSVPCGEKWNTKSELGCWVPISDFLLISCVTLSMLFHLFTPHCLELRRGIQDASCVGPGKSNLPLELRRKAGHCSRVTVGPIDLI